MKFFRGSKFRIDKAQYKYNKYCSLRDKWGDCSIEVVAPVLARGAQLASPSLKNAEGCALLYVIGENATEEFDDGFQRVRAVVRRFPSFFLFLEAIC